MRQISTMIALLTVACLNTAYAQTAYKKRAADGHKQVVSALLQMNGGSAASRTTAGVPTERVIAQSTWDNGLTGLTDSVRLGYTGMRRSKYDYNNMMYGYNYPYATTPMFTYWGVHTTPQVQYDTFIHWTINPFTMPAFGLYEASFATYNTGNCLTSFRELFVDSATNDNRSYANTFTASGNISKGYWFNLNAGVEDSAFKQYFEYGAGDRLVKDSVYELHLGVWRIAAKSTYSYDGTGNLVQIDHYANETDTSFLLPLVQQTKYVNTYDASNRLKTVFTSMFDGTSLSPYVKDTFEYSGGYPWHTAWRQHQFDEIHGTWWPQYRMTKHVASAKPDTIYHDGWDSILNKWTPIAKDYARYNSDGNPDTVRKYEWNWTSYSMAPDYTTVYYYQTFTDTTTVSLPAAPVKGMRLAVYPNPASNVLTVDAGVTEGHDYAVSICDAAGRLLSRQSLRSGHMELPVSHLAPGMYWLYLDDRSTGARYQRQFVRE